MGIGKIDLLFQNSPGGYSLAGQKTCRMSLNLPPISEPKILSWWPWGHWAVRKGLPVLEKALGLEDREIKFNAVVALGKIPKGFSFDWTLVESFLTGEDKGLVQAAALTLATHRVKQAQEKIKKLLVRKEKNLRYAGAMGLINYRDEDASSILREILLSDFKKQNLSEHELRQLKINIITLLEKEDWPVLNNTLRHLAENSHVKIAASALKALNKLKKH